MNIISLILRVLAVAGAIAAVVLFFQIKDFHEEMENEITSTRGQIQVSEANLREMTDDRDSERARADGLQSDLEDARAEIDVLERNLAQTERDLQEARGELRDARRQISSLENERDELNRRNQELDRRIVRLEDEHERTLASLRSQVASLEQELADVPETIEDEGFAGGLDWGIDEDPVDETPAPVVGPVRGTVAAVGSESSFVVLDLGSDSGMRENLLLGVFRGDRVVARVRVSDAREDLSIAQVQPGTLDGRIRPGDTFRSID